MPLKLFEFLEQVMTHRFLIELTQFEKNWINRKTFDSAGKSEI